MKTGFGTGVRSKLARAIFGGAVALAGVAAFAMAMTWAVPRTFGTRAEAAVRSVVTSSAHRPGEPTAKPAILADDGKSQGKPACSECGIIVAVQKIETPLDFTGWCDAAEVARSQNSGRAYGRDFRMDREPLRDSVAAAIAASGTTTKEAVNTRHRIVVRMRNGSRQVFEETAPRMVNVGDRMLVIAGAPGVNG